VWLSEIMLQQTQVATVVPYYWRFLAEFPDVGALAAAPLERVLEHWSGLGYYRRAHHLHAAARVIVAEHGGSFPRDVEALAALPGIGRSTAAAIAAFSFSVRAAILDGNVKRVLARHRGIEGFPGSARVETALWRVAESLLPANDIETYTQALMDLGATVCTRTRPQCERPVAATASRDGRPHRCAALAAPGPAAAAARAAGAAARARRQPAARKARPGRYLGRIVSLPEMALDDDVAAHCRARFGAQVTGGDALPTIEHGFTHFRLTLHPQRVAVRRWPARAEAPGYAWLLPGDALAAALPAPIRKLLRSIAVPALPSRQPRARTR
jgi:A/G-specific adenine glycosylase